MLVEACDFRHHLERTEALIAHVDVLGDALFPLRSCLMTVLCCTPDCDSLVQTAVKRPWPALVSKGLPVAHNYYCLLHPNVSQSSARCMSKRGVGLLAGQGPAAGPYAQGWGPLRVWPGGLCLSRALGDFDVGHIVLAIPHVMQVCRSYPVGLSMSAPLCCLMRHMHSTSMPPLAHPSCESHWVWLHRE